jgi:prepilin-type N-terminal cleavage/methylation domain-containing protein
LKNRCGFTLLELVLVMVLLGIAAVMVVPFVGHIFSNLLEGRELSHRESQAVMALERFVRDVREGKDITLSNDGLEMTFTTEENGAEIELNYEIDLDEGTLGVNEKPLAKHLVAGSKFEEETNTNSYMVILEIQMPNTESLKLSAIAFPRMDQ